LTATPLNYFSGIIHGVAGRNLDNLCGGVSLKRTRSGSGLDNPALFAKNIIMSMQSGLVFVAEDYFQPGVSHPGVESIGLVIVGNENTPAMTVSVRNRYTAGFTLVNPARPVTGIRIPFNIDDARRKHGLNVRLCVYAADNYPYDFSDWDGGSSGPAAHIGLSNVAWTTTRTPDFWLGKSTTITIDPLSPITGIDNFPVKGPGEVTVKPMFNDILTVPVQAGDIIPCNYQQDKPFCWVLMCVSIDSFSPLGNLEIPPNLTFETPWSCDRNATMSLIQ